MSTIPKKSSVWFWVWILVAFILGAVLGFIAGAGAILAIAALTDYAPSPH